MGLAVVPQDWTGLYIEQCVRWPDSPEWLAILRGQLAAPYETDFWDKFTGDPSDAQDAIEATFNQNLHTEECMRLPPGAILEFAGVTAPTGFLFCFGQEVSRNTYADLFAAIGTRFGVGNGTTTFNVPDRRGKVGVGWSDVDNDFNDVGNTGGAKTHTLSPSEMPVHTHVQNAHTHVQNAHTHVQNAHTHVQNAHVHSQTGNPVILGTSASFVTSSGTAQVKAEAPASTTPTNQNTTPTNQNTTPTNQNTTPTNQNTGGDGEHNNLQPYVVFTYIIKV